ncbi:MAG TPA: PDZ domain-containing protein, partial [Anaerolineae bacterium]|nr:PDZ domain-containing protein [Anaerolineae bacterium]
VVGTDPASDLAVIQVEGVDASLLRPVTLGDSDSLRVGEIVATIGNPFGLDGSMSTGIIAGVGRLLPSGASAPGGGRFNIPDIIQTDSVINPGNSGGPLLNLKGEVIGVNTAIATNGFSIQPSFGGVGYVVPSNIVKEVVPELIENGRIAHPWLGISGGTLVSAYAEAMNLDSDQRGVLVDDVLENSPASKAGLVGSNQEVTIDGFPVQIGGDVITRIDDQPILEFDDLLAYIVRQTKPGQEVTLTILRDGEEMQVKVTMEARPEQ